MQIAHVLDMGNQLSSLVKAILESMIELRNFSNARKAADETRKLRDLLASINGIVYQRGRLVDKLEHIPKILPIRGMTRELITDQQL